MYSGNKNFNTRRNSKDESDFWFRRPFTQFTIVVLWLVGIGLIIFVVWQWMQIIIIESEKVYYTELNPPTYLKEHISRLSPLVIERYTQDPSLLESRLHDPLMGGKEYWDKAMFIYRYLHCKILIETDKLIVYLDVGGKKIIYSREEWSLLWEELFNWFNEEDARVANWREWLQYEHLRLQNKLDNVNFKQHFAENRLYREDYYIKWERWVNDWIDEVLWLIPQNYNRTSLEEAKLDWSWEEVKDYEKRRSCFYKELDAWNDKIARGEVDLFKDDFKVSSKYFKPRNEDLELFSNKKKISEELGIDERWILSVEDDDEDA